MKKLISILTMTSFSLVPTINIIACQNKADEDIVGETIKQEIVDGAIDEMNSTKWFQNDYYMEEWSKDPDIKSMIPDIENKPEFIVMAFVVTACAEIIEKANDDKFINKLNLELKDEHFLNLSELLKRNLRKFKVLPFDKEWFQNLKKIEKKDSTTFRFKLQFGKTISENTVKIKMYWNIK